MFHSSAYDLDLKDLPSFRQPSQYYVFFTQEPPPKAGWKDRSTLWYRFPLNFFNLTMTYRRDSDIYFPYDRLVPISFSKEVQSTSETSQVENNETLFYSWQNVVNVVKKKDKMALQFVGNCYSESGREKVVRSLQKSVEVDQFGYCAGKVCQWSCEQDIISMFTIGN